MDKQRLRVKAIKPMFGFFDRVGDVNLPLAAQCLQLRGPEVSNVNRAHALGGGEHFPSIGE